MEKPIANTLTSSEAQVIVSGIQAFAESMAAQADATRHQSDVQLQAARHQNETSVKHAEIQAQTQRHQLIVAAWLTFGGLVMIAGLVAASFFVGKYEIATHAVAAVGGALGGWFAGKSKR